MPITSSGEIALIADIEAEFDQTGDTDISLFQARDDAGLTAGEVSMTDFYGLSDVAAATVVTNAASNVNASSMTLNGNVTGDGGGTISSRGFYFGTSSTYSNNTKYTVGSGTGTFNTNRTGLSGSTTYYITAFAVNEAGEVVGSTVSQATATPISFVNRRFDIDECITHTITYYYSSGGAWVQRFSVGGTSDQNRSVATGTGSRLICSSGTAISCNTVNLHSSFSGLSSYGTGYALNYGTYIRHYSYTNLNSFFNIL